MPADTKRKTRAGRRQVAFWIPQDAYDAWTAFVEGRPGATLTGEVLVAMARHMASPPPLPAAVPLPPPAPKRKPGRPKKVQNNS